MDDRPVLLDLKQEVKNLTQDARSLPEFTVYPGNNGDFDNFLVENRHFF